MRNNIEYAPDDEPEFRELVGEDVGVVWPEVEELGILTGGTWDCVRREVAREGSGWTGSGVASSTVLLRERPSWISPAFKRDAAPTVWGQ